MKKTLLACLALAGGLSLAPLSAEAEITAESGRAIVAPFYDALNAAPGKDAADILRRVTAPEWVSCGTNEVCGAREQVIAAIGSRLKAIPDLKWEIREVLVSGDRVIVRGEASGTPAGEFM